MSLFSRALYRARQFREALRPTMSAAEQREAEETLGPDLAPLFASMQRRDQRHCFDVYASLRRPRSDRGGDQEILQAALLHDAGKGRLAGAHVRLWHRVAYVLLEAASPGLLHRLARDRNAFACLHNHPARGAALAQAHGASPAVVDLIARHEQHDAADERLHLLRAADDAG